MISQDSSEEKNYLARDPYPRGSPATHRPPSVAKARRNFLSSGLFEGQRRADQRQMGRRRLRSRSERIFSLGTQAERRCAWQSQYAIIGSRFFPSHARSAIASRGNAATMDAATLFPLTANAFAPGPSGPRAASAVS